MDAKENTSIGEPFKHGRLPLELPQWKGCADPDVEPNHVGCLGWKSDAVDILGHLWIRRNVGLRCKAAKSGVLVNGEYSVVAVDFLKHL